MFRRNPMTQGRLEERVEMGRIEDRADIALLQGTLDGLGQSLPAGWGNGNRWPRVAKAVRRLSKRGVHLDCDGLVLVARWYIVTSKDKLRERGKVLEFLSRAERRVKPDDTRRMVEIAALRHRAVKRERSTSFGWSDSVRQVLDEPAHET